MSEQQKGGEFKGKYEDNDSVIWDWECAAPVGGEEKGDAKAEGKTLGRYQYNAEDYLWLEIIIWILFISGAFWIFGLPIIYPLGVFYTNWFYWTAII